MNESYECINCGDIKQDGSTCGICASCIGDIEELEQEEQLYKCPECGGETYESVDDNGRVCIACTRCQWLTI